MPVLEVTCVGGLAKSNAIRLAGNLKAAKLEWFLISPLYLVLNSASAI